MAEGAQRDAPVPSHQTQPNMAWELWRPVFDNRECYTEVIYSSSNHDSLQGQ